MSYDFASLFLAPFFGVLLGFAANYAYRAWIDRNTRRQYRSLFRSEMKDSINRLQKAKGHLIPDSHWDSAVNSGDLRVFSSTQRNKLSQTYFTMHCYNYEAEKWRDMRDKGRAEAEQRVLEVIQLAEKQAWETTCKAGEDALRKMQDLAKEEWFKDP